MYGLNHLFYTVDKDIPGKKPLMGPLKTATPYHIRCLVPCYKESLQILQVSYRGCSSAFASQRGSCFFCSGPSCTIMCSMQSRGSRSTKQPQNLGTARGGSAEGLHAPRAMQKSMQYRKAGAP